MSAAKDVYDALAKGGGAAQTTARHLQQLLLENTADYWSQRAASFEALGDHGSSMGIARAFRNRALWLRFHRIDPADLTPVEQWVADREADVAWAVPPSELSLETTAHMISRHRRVLTALDDAASHIRTLESV